MGSALIIRRVPAEKDPHPLRMSDAEDDLWVVQIPSGAGHFSHRAHGLDANRGARVLRGRETGHLQG